MLSTRLRVIDTLASLPEDQRQALVARYVEGCSVEKLAQQIGKTYKAAESLLARARAAFREALAPLDGESYGK